MKENAKCLSTENMRCVLGPLVILLTMLLAGCTMELLNARPAKEINPPPAQGNLYAGWRVFQGKCASCHGMTAMGSERAPDLLPIVRNMNARQFAEVVLQRYDLGNGIGSRSSARSTIDTRIEEILRLNEAPIEMPAMQGEPAVSAHILDLYAYVLARSEGTLGLGAQLR